MLLLALETATAATSVALVRQQETVASVDDDSGRPHSERLLPAIEALLAQVGIGQHEIEGYAVSLGPGSFTGLRIGVATAQGFSLVDGRPTFGVPTLAALALAAEQRGPAPVAALLDARRGEVYAAGYSDPWSGQADVLAEGLYGPEQVAEALPRGAWLVIGAGADGAREAVLRTTRDLHVVQASCRASRVGVLAAGLSGLRADSPLTPRYVRRAEAEVKRTGQPTEPPSA